MNYSVRIGKINNTVYVRSAKGSVLRYNTELPSRAAAKKLSTRVRSVLRGGGRLDSNLWTIIKQGDNNVHS